MACDEHNAHVGGKSVKRVRSSIVVSALVCILSASQVCFAKTPPGNWPKDYHIWYCNTLETHNPTVKTLWGVTQEEATQGAISPDGKHIAYVAKGPYLVVRTFNQARPMEGVEVIRIPWGVSPMWYDKSTVYFAVLEQFDNIGDFSWFCNIVGMYRFDMKTNRVDCLVEGNYYPGSIAPKNWGVPREKDPFVFTYITFAESEKSKKPTMECYIMLGKAGVGYIKPYRPWINGMSPVFDYWTLDYRRIAFYAPQYAVVAMFDGDYDNVRTCLKGHDYARPGGFTTDDKYLVVDVANRRTSLRPLSDSNVRWTVWMVRLQPDSANRSAGDEMPFLDMKPYSFKDINFMVNTNEFVISSTMPFAEKKQLKP